MSDLRLFFFFLHTRDSEKKAVKQSTDKKKTSTRGTPPTASRKSRRSNIHTHTHTHTHTHVRIGACVQKVDGVEEERGGALTEKKKGKPYKEKAKGPTTRSHGTRAPSPSTDTQK